MKEKIHPREIWYIMFLASVLAFCHEARGATAPSCDEQADVSRALGNDEFHTFVHQGLQRSYIIHVSAGYRPAVPTDVVFVLHGGFGSGCQVRESSRMNELPWRHNLLQKPYIFVYPNGFASRFLYGDMGQHWNDDRVSRKLVDDVDFLHTVLHRLKGTHRLNVNQRRVFAVGISNGGKMAYKLARDSDRFTAITAISSLLPASYVRPGAPPLKPVPTMVIEGTEDGHMPWEGGPSAYTKEEVLSGEETFNRLNEAIGSPRVLTDRYFGREFRSRGIEGFEWMHQSRWVPGARDRKRVELIKIHGGGHCWPSPHARPFIGSGGWCATGIDAGYEALVFFDNQPSR